MKPPAPGNSTFVLKRCLIATFAVGLSLVLFSAPLTAQASPETPSVQLTVRSEGEALALGFEEGFRTLKGPIFVTYSGTDRALAVLSGVRSLRAAGATVIIRTDGGSTLILPATAIVVVTDERP